MLPTRWLDLTALPKNPNGKIDRARLREMLAEPSQSAENAKEVA
jgi:acyl-coenzyme A synthetase/AMP-(fatty) acid ligase